MDFNQKIKKLKFYIKCYMFLTRLILILEVRVIIVEFKITLKHRSIQV